MRFNANTGQYFVQSHAPLGPLAIRIEYPDQLVTFDGAVLQVTQRFDSLDELNALVEGVVFGLPPLLAVAFADPPIVERVEGEIGGVGFRWELSGWKADITTTTQDEQQLAAATAWERLALLNEPEGRRLHAALHYFHTAVRLDRASATIGEFMAEALLNFTKCLEVLFPPAGDGQTREAVRAGLRNLGYDDTSMERQFLPAMALRNEIDVGHVSLALFTASQLRTIHSYTAIAEASFREMLGRVLERVHAGTLAMSAYDNAEPSNKARQLIERLAEAFDSREADS